MTLTGRCYCGAVTYRSDGDPLWRAQCHCRECQYISGGGPNYFLLLPADGFVYTAGTPRAFTRPDLARPVTREFCPTCGTHLITRLPDRPMVVLKVGTLDDPAAYGGPKMAIHTADMQPFHILPDDLPRTDRAPPG